MYEAFFGLTEPPFSITPDPRYLFPSSRHTEALGHLFYGVSAAGGFIQLTGEVGTGKTTVVRSLLAREPADVDIALILNPRVTVTEFLQTICEELGVAVRVEDGGSVKALVDALTARLLEAHAAGRRVAVLIDEAHLLERDVLEQVRLLTNIETATRKLLQIILIGQPELRDLLAREDMRQVAQRITGRLHLDPLSAEETAAYVRHRLRVAGATREIFSASALRELHRRGGGLPRLINVIADRAMLGAYARDRHEITPALVRAAAAEVSGEETGSKRWSWLAIAASVLIVGALLAFSATLLAADRNGSDIAKAQGEWPAFGRDPGGSQHSPLTQIDTRNVKTLRRVWTHRSGDFIDAPSPRGSILQATPLHVNGTLYFCTPFNRVFALDPATGRERWVFDPHRADPQTGRAALSPPLAQPSRCRGVAYWAPGAASVRTNAACERRIFKNGDNSRMYALDADTGALCTDFGAARGHPGWVTHADFENRGDGQMAASTSPPVVLGDLVITAMAVNDGIANAKDGIVRAFDVRSGELRWEFNPIPDEFSNRSGAANVWSTISVDVANNLVFLPTTSPSTDYYGGGRRFDMPLANAIVALDGKTGKVVWSRQIVRHDLFDYDLVGHPLLVDIRRDGRLVQAALLQTKMGWLYGFERKTGEPLWPVVERPVPASDVPGEMAAATQPVPNGMAAFARQELKREDLFGITPIDAYACRRRFDELRYEGMYTPPSIRGSILFPSALGGGNWGGAAYDPATNLLIIKAENLATVLRVIPKTSAADDEKPPTNYLTRPLLGTPYRIEGELFNSPLGVPCTPPPWGTLMALDLGTGKPRWQIPLGQIRRAGVTVPKGAGWGSPNVGGPITTAGGITFIGATMDSKLRAFDTSTGKELWIADLPVPGMAVPMTYAVNGKQYVVIAAGGNAQVGTPIGDYLIAYALPD